MARTHLGGCGPSAFPGGPLFPGAVAAAELLSNVPHAMSACPDRRRDRMGLGDKISNAANEAAGKAKEGLGNLTDNSELEREGQTQQAGANVRQAGEDVKDGVNSAGQNLKKAGSSASANAKEAWDDASDKK